MLFEFAMASSSFVFDEDDPPLLPDPSDLRPSTLFLLPTCELNFDAYVEVSPPNRSTGGMMMMKLLIQ